MSKYNKEYALQKLKELYNLVNRIPTKDDFKINNWKPFYEYYRRYFGSYGMACYLAGIADKPLTEEERIHISIDELVKLANKLHRCPTVSEYESIKHKGINRRDLEKKLGLNYCNICKKFIPEYKVNIDRDITRDQIIADIKSRLINGSVTYEEMRKNGFPYDKGLIKRKCGLTFNQILQSLGYLPVKGSTIKKSEEEMLNEFYQYFLELKRIPYFDDLNNNPNVPSSTTYIKYFGSIENVCKLLDIDFEENYKGAGAGKILYDKLGNLCKSYVERNITNFLIDNGIKFEKEYKYKNIIPNHKKIFDWVIYYNNKKYYVEYFGMYRNDPRGSIDKKYYKRTRKKIKDLYKADLIDDCIFIFPWDIKNRSLENIFSFLKICTQKVS